MLYVGYVLEICLGVNSIIDNVVTSDLPVNDPTVRPFTIKTPTTLEFEYSVFIYKFYSKTTYFT